MSPDSDFLFAAVSSSSVVLTRASDPSDRYGVTWCCGLSYNITSGLCKYATGGDYSPFRIEIVAT